MSFQHVTAVSGCWQAAHRCIDISKRATIRCPKMVGLTKRSVMLHYRHAFLDFLPGLAEAPLCGFELVRCPG
ncbi:hypothetical protein SALB_00747 [Streptomyces noursei]|uniref:Uncharacterized protein n=1 Tax=Streptomyces noursei TaxID=1971 RepID=A0A401QRY6_STRNR|nr:hypothetical protein SALB_00747 [Streptomyces noursei]